MVLQGETKSFNGEIVKSTEFGCRYASFRDEMECFRSCDGLPFVENTCFTTRGEKDDFEFVPCHWQSDCQADWDCGGLCLPF